MICQIPPKEMKAHIGVRQKYQVRPDRSSAGNPLLSVGFFSNGRLCASVPSEVSSRSVSQQQ